MKFARQCVLAMLCFHLGAVSALAQTPDLLLQAIPADALGFAVIHDLTSASRSVDDLAKLVQAPAPNLLGMAKGLTLLPKGVNENGDLAIVLTGIDDGMQHVVLAPVASFDDFFSALDVESPPQGVVEVELAGTPLLVGRKGAYAALAPANGREALEHFLASKNHLGADASLATWLDERQASLVVNRHGIEQLLPKLIDGIRTAQMGLLQAGGDQAKPAADALNLYLQLFTAAEREVAQFCVGLRIDAGQNGATQTVDVAKRVQFVPEGAWAKWAANAQPATEDLLAGIPDVPFVMAIGGVVPPGAMEQMMKFSVEMMQNHPLYKLTPEQAKEYAKASAGAMTGVHSLRMVVGVPDKPEDGIYGNMSGVMMVDDSQRYMNDYEKALAAMAKLAPDAKGSPFPVSTSRRFQVDDIEALEVTMELPSMQQFAQPNGPDMQKLIELFAGPDGKIKVFIAPADAHAIVMAYTSQERLKAALDFYQSKQAGLSSNAGVARVAAVLPVGSQAVMYVSLGGVAKVAQQVATKLVGERAAAIPELPDSPPLGMAAKLSPSGVEGHLTATAETLRTIGDAIAAARGVHADPDADAAE